MANELKGTKKIQSANTPANAVSFLIESMMNGKINTMTPVIVVSVNKRTKDSPWETGTHRFPAGRVSVRPLVCQRDAEGNALDMAECFELPYARIQGGKCAVVCDPQPGDLGIAIYAQTDTSNVKTTIGGAPVQPGSFRTFSQSDGWYIGGFLNKYPETYIELTKDEEILIHAPKTITLEADRINVRCREYHTWIHDGDSHTYEGIEHEHTHINP